MDECNYVIAADCGLYKHFLSQHTDLGIIDKLCCCSEDLLSYGQYLSNCILTLFVLFFSSYTGQCYELSLSLSTACARFVC